MGRNANFLGAPYTQNAKNSYCHIEKDTHDVYSYFLAEGVCVGIVILRVLEF